jgi:CubicO group peptidase (beta-lactamase class C family)
VDGALLERLTRSWPVTAVAVGVTDAGGTLAATGPQDRPFPLASVTKVLVSMAIWVAVEEETLGLDDPAGPPGSTVRHLLAHASGLAPDEARPLARPGTGRIYSNAGFEVLGAELERRGGLDTATYLDEAVLAPLGCRATTLAGSPAHGAHGCVDDLLRIGRELLSPTLIDASTLREATSPQFPTLAGVLPGFGRHDPNPWGLGVELRGAKAPHWTGTGNSPATFGHFGRSGTFLWVDPEAGLAVAVLTDREFGTWATTAWPTLSDAVLAAGR